MSLILRNGVFGNYWGNTYDSSNHLSEEQMKVNATYLYNSLSNKGWTLNAIAGVLGNMQTESSINPGRWQSENVGDLDVGYSLVQWTPARKYIDWLANGADPSEMDNAISRIIYEVENNIQWIATANYNYSFYEFTKSNDTPYNLGMAFLYNYERPADQNQPWRGTQAETWYEFLSGNVPVPPTPEKRKNNFKWVIYSRKLRSKKLL